VSDVTQDPTPGETVSKMISGNETATEAGISSNGPLPLATVPRGLRRHRRAELGSTISLGSRPTGLL
jgi:hypothetical protein